MRIFRKLLACSLTALLVLTLASAGLADSRPTFASALAAGREVSFSAKFEWHSPEQIDDDEANRIIASLADALTITGQFAMLDESTTYTRYDVLLDNKSVLPMDMIIHSGGYVFSSPIFGQNPMAVPFDEYAATLAKMGAYMDEATGTDELEMAFSQMGEAFEAVFEQLNNPEMYVEPVESADPIAELGLENIALALDAWAADALGGVPYDGAIETDFPSVSIASSVAYEVDKDDLIDLVAIVMPLLLENEALMDAALDGALMTYSAQYPAEDIDAMKAEALAMLPEIMAMLPDAIAEVIPDGTVAQYIESYDKKGAPALNQIVFSMPENDIGAPELYVTVEWIPETCELCVKVDMPDDNSILRLKAESDPVQAIDLDTATTTKTGCRVTLTVYDTTRGSSYATYTKEFEIGLVEKKQVTETAVKRLTNSTLDINILPGRYDDPILLRFNADVIEACDDIDVTKDCTIDFSVVYEGETVDLLTMYVSVASGEPQGLPLDPKDDANFVYPGRMDDETFTQWMEEGVQTGFIQTVLRIISELPPEAFAVIAPNLNF